MLRTVLTFLVMVGTAFLVFAAAGVLSWQMAGAVLVGSGVGAAFARVRLPSGPRTTSGTGSAQ